MPENQSLLYQLEQMLHWKKSKKFYADKLNITENEVDELMRELRNSQITRDDAETANYIGELEDTIVRFIEDVQKGTGEVVLNSKEEIKSLEELIEKCKIDTDKWEITKYVQNYWGNAEQPHYQVKAWLGKKKGEQMFQDSFIEFLSEYSPVSQEIMSPKIQPGKPVAALVINKQDAHYNKADVNGDNNLEERFARMAYRVETILSQAALSNNLDKVIYIIGSDEFNSEFTGTTTKGTPQQNIEGYHKSFEAICNHEILMITLLLQYADNVDVVYVAGNHDEYVGWHLINWLQTYFRNTERLTFDCSPRYRKYVSYGAAAMMFNHGDAIKPAKLAGIFPMEYKDGWSDHEVYYIFTGDKHHELSQDFNGIKFYQIPAFSNAKSGWDEKNGYTCARGEVTAFLIDHNDGMTNIFKQYL
ncbi:MAG: hypothetical protein EBR30_01985 [Cytophagia bacterium]|nr:hypothetical protein [Cytophagia bacterium]